MNLDDYNKLIPPPNSIQPNFMSWNRAHWQVQLDAQALNETMHLYFRIDTGVGAQLDILGEILDVARQVTFIPGGGISPVLPDDLYRLVLRAKVLINKWDGTTKQIYDFWNKYLPQYKVIIIDNQDMSETILITGMDNDLVGIRLFGFGEDDANITGFGDGYWEPVNNLLRELVLHFYLLPKPAAVKVNFIFLEGQLFGFGEDNQYISGFGPTHWLEI